MRRVSWIGMSKKVDFNAWNVAGQVPSGCGKSVPQSMLSMPIS